MCLFLMGGQFYHVPPSLNLRRPCCRLDLPLMVVSGDSLLVSGELGVEGIILVGGGAGVLT